MMNIRQTDTFIGTGTFKTTPRVRELVNEVLDSERISYGEKSKRLEREFAMAHDAAFAIISNSGTSALHVAVQALKEYYEWEDGDEIIVPATTFVATPNVVIHNRLKPVFVDIEHNTYGMDWLQLEKKITDKTRAIIPVHLFGQPCRMDKIMPIAKKHGLKVIEDSCETMFVSQGGKKVGSIGDIGCFSTYAAHLLVTGVGGFSITNNPDLAAKMRSLVNHGLEIGFLNTDDNFAPRPMPNRRFRFDAVGHSFRITEFEAAVGLAQLEEYPRMLRMRNRNAKHLSQGLRNANRDFGKEIFWIPEVHFEHAWMMFPIVLNWEEADQPLPDKEPLMAFLNKHDIETRDMLPLMNQGVNYGISEEDYPVSHWILKSGFYVGCHQDLEVNEVSDIISVINYYLDLNKD